MKTVSLCGKVVSLDGGYPSVQVETVDGVPAREAFLREGSIVETVADTKWGGHSLPDLKVGDDYEIRMTPGLSRFVSYHANGWSHVLSSGRTRRDEYADAALAPIDRFVVVYRTKAGRLGAWSDWTTRAQAEENARDRAAFTGRAHWTAELVSRAEPSAPTVEEVT